MKKKGGGSGRGSRGGVVVEQQTKKACVLETNGRRYYDLIFSLSFHYNETNHIIVEPEARDYLTFTNILKMDYDRRLHLSSLLYENMDKAVDAYCRTLGNSPAMRKTIRAPRIQEIQFWPVRNIPFSFSLHFETHRCSEAFMLNVILRMGPYSFLSMR